MKPALELSRVPVDKGLRERIRNACAQDVLAREDLLLGRRDLEARALAVLKRCGISESYRDYTMVLLNTESQRKALAAVPFKKRLLLLPRCLRDSKRCRGSMDELGLSCAHCGACVISELVRHAASLGVSVLVAEGSPVVLALLASGGFGALIGVSCLSMLEKMHAQLPAGALTAVALPLLSDGCRNTKIDADVLYDLINERQEGETAVSLAETKAGVKKLFDCDCLLRMIQQPETTVTALGLDVLAGAGKRWRPVLFAGTYLALSGKSELDESARLVCVAIECFHKASLIHDDIEDGDLLRDGVPSVYARQGIPVALNLGDWLIGLGYELLCRVDPALARHAAAGHLDLCQGQGRELAGETDSLEDIMFIHVHKTAAAFVSAIALAASLARSHEHELLVEIAKHVGLAYQIQDDLADGQNTDTETNTEPQKRGNNILCVLQHDPKQDVRAQARMLRDRELQSARNACGRLQSRTAGQFLLNLCRLILDDPA